MDNLKLIMFTDVNKKEKIFAGVLKKMYGQLKTFTSHGIECYFIYKFDKDLVLENMQTEETFRRTPESTVDVYNILYEYIQDIDVDNIYIRKPFLDHRLINFLQKTKLTTKRKIILEIPTYPYDLEMRGHINVNIEKHWRKELKYYVDLLVSYTKEDEIFGIKTINIFNGIDVDTIQVSNNIPRDNELHMIAVASLADWHGYDMVIHGMGEYYKKEVDKDVYFHIVGNEQQNGILASLRALADEYGLENKVIFHGFKEGKELDDIFDISDIGVGSLGLQRINLKFGSTLKEQEYCARGLPIVNGFRNLSFHENYNYITTLFNGETVVDINQIIEFYTNIIKYQNYKREIRRYAEINLTWNKSLEPVVDWILATNF